MDNIEASESIYESSILTFATNEESLYDSFLIMRDMEESKGYVPSTALIETFARIIGHDQVLFKQAESIILGNLYSNDNTPEIHNNTIDAQQGLPLSLASINVILSVYGDRGYHNKTKRVIHQLANKGLKPNADSILFSLESIGRCLLRDSKRSSSEEPSSSFVSFPSDIKREHDICAKYTEDLLFALEESMIPPTSAIIHNYVEILCHLGHTETATLVVLDALKNADNESSGANSNAVAAEDEITPIKQKKRRRVVENKTLHRVAIATASELRDFELASYFASRTSEPLPFIQNKIDKIKADQLKNIAS